MDQVQNTSAPSPRGMSKTSAITTIIIVAIVFGVGGFFGGRAYAKSKTPASPTTRSFAGGSGFAGGAGGGYRRGGTGTGAAGGGFSTGQILSIGNGTMTIKTANGGSQIVYYSSSTSVTLPTVVSPSSLQVGQNVTVIGSTDSSTGAVTANSIQVRPASSTMPSNMAPMMPAQ